MPFLCAEIPKRVTDYAGCGRLLAFRLSRTLARRVSILSAEGVGPRAASRPQIVLGIMGMTVMPNCGTIVPDNRIAIIMEELIERTAFVSLRDTLWRVGMMVGYDNVILRSTFSRRNSLSRSFLWYTAGTKSSIMLKSLKPRHA